MFNVGRLLKSVQILTTCESFQCKSRWQHQFARVFLVYRYQRAKGCLSVFCVMVELRKF